METQLPPVMLQTQHVWTGERDVEHTERGKQAEGQKRAHPGCPCTTGTVL